MIAEGAQTESPRSGRSSKKSKFGRFLLLVISYALVALIVWQIQARMGTDPAKQQAAAEKEVKSLVSKVEEHMILPTDESPQVATIQDAESLSKAQAFFVNAKNGDQILIYLKAQKAIIYRPDENKIVNVGPIITDNSGATKTTTQTSNSSQTKN